LYIQVLVRENKSDTFTEEDGHAAIARYAHLSARHVA
jgi:hypothetical protein